MNPKSQHPLDLQLEAGLRGDFETGWKLAEVLRQMDPNDNRAKFNRAWYEMWQGRLLEGLKLLDAGRWVRAFGDQPLTTSKPIYHGEDLTGKHLLLCSEGGLGDEIINARFAQNFSARGAKVTVTCDPSLKSVFARMPGVSAVVGHKAAPEVYHDYWVPAMSAARVLELEYQDLSGKPYLFASPDYIEKWRGILHERYGRDVPRIGLRFYGNPKFEHEQHRRFPRDELIAAIGGRSWINLQKEDTDLPIENWEDTLALLSHLDLVITSCTSVAHAAAALGKETWILIPILPYYLWALPGETTPWYESVRLFRQRKFGEWQTTFADVAIELESWWKKKA